ncbi:extracellular solute-binding protein [Paenibacillus agaridevorans]|uniref:extracellular solute-binding protein n=1 Tax=Paenibacillus agaridevorans TaxID=171404 RepID=UPI001BE48DAB|nr:extracellular solute-binding protein [Paenibacillus agaridevorans]
MNMRWKKSLMTAATAMLVPALIAGCGSSNTNSNSDSKGTQGTERSTITATLYDRGNVPPAAGTVDNNIWSKWINEHSPVGVDFVPFPRSEQVQKLNLLFASGDAPDLIFEYDGSFLNQLYSQKQLLKLDDLIAEHSTTYKQMTEKYPQLLTLGQMGDGGTYLVGRVQGLKTNSYVLIRRDWLDKLKLDMPKTTEELFEVAKAFREQDPDGNGERDTFGINMGGGNAEVLFNAIFQNGGRFVQDGQMVNPAVGEQAKASADFQKRLFEAGIVDKDFLTDKTGEVAKQQWVSGKLGIYISSSGIDNALLLEAYKSMLKNNTEAVIDVMPLPEGPYGTFNPQYKSPIQMTTAINAKAKDPKAVMQYIDFLVTEDTTMTLKNGIEGVHYTKDAEGVALPIDAEKNKAELVGMLDYNMLSFFITLPKKEQAEVKLNMDVPAEKSFRAIIEAAHAAYLNPDHAYANPIINWPGLSPDLQIILKNTETMGDMWRKAIVSGSKYTTEQALADVQALWNSAGGTKIDQFYSDWLKEKPDSVLYISDFK